MIDIVQDEGTVAVRDLAGRLGVHVVTVRRDLDDLVEEGHLDRRHGYVSRPSATAVAEPAAPSGPVTVGLVVPVRDYYFGEVINGVRDAANERGIQVLLRLTEYDEGRDSTQVRTLLDAGVHGVLFTPATAESDLDHRVFERFADRSTPVVVLERPLAPGHVLAAHDAVFADHRHGVAEAVRYLHRAGRQGIAMLTQRDDPGSRYLLGYVEAMATLGLDVPVEPQRVPSASADPELAAAIVDGLERRIRDGSVDALVIQNDATAIEVVDALSGRGIAVPDDVAVIAYDDEVAEFARIPLTAVSPPKRAVGRLALEALDRRIREAADLDSRPATVQHQGLLPTLTIRRSTP